MPLEYLTIAVRFALYASLTVLFGWPLFAVYALPAGIAAGMPSRRVLALLSLAAAVFSVAGIVAMAATMAGSAFTAVDRPTIDALIFETPMGAAWQVRMAALALLLATVLLGGLQHRLVRLLASALAAAALASLAWTGHGAAGEGFGGWLQLGADVTHLFAAGAWIGALAALLQLLGRRAIDTTPAVMVVAHQALDRFAIAGTVIVGLLVGTGLISVWMLVGPDHVFDLLDSEYGRFLVAKLLLFAAMLGLAASNRFRLTPALGRQIGSGVEPAAAFAALRRSIFAEAALAGGIMAAVAWLGTLAPPMAM